MTRIILAVAILAYVCLQPAAAASWCDGVIMANSDCLLTVPAVIVRCDYYDAKRNDHRCTGITDHRKLFDADPTATPQAPAPRRRKDKN
jgi:hypothetical protein